MAVACPEHTDDHQWGVWYHSDARMPGDWQRDCTQCDCREVKFGPMQAGH